MDLFLNYIKKFVIKLKKSTPPAVSATSSTLFLVACGGGSDNSGKETYGFPDSYIPPKQNYDPPKTDDPYAEIINVPYTEPYWVQALLMNDYQSQISPLIDNYDRKIGYTFPDFQPKYDHFTVRNWQPSTELMKSATREILSEIELIIDIQFIEVSDPFAHNVIAIGRSDQTSSSGISHYPNIHYYIGMDLFIANGYEFPEFINDQSTNYAYEVLVHEIGHSLGLKHPFAIEGINEVVLTSYEDRTENTAMSYNNDNQETFNGSLRPLDWMALTKLYGVNSSHNANDDTYSFSNSGGIFIIDGGGIDEISTIGTSRDVTIDLRPGSHSFINTKSTYITYSNQLTISHGSIIENVVTGSGNDTVIGNNFNNIINTGFGNDIIIAGDGSDLIDSGGGSDSINLSETIQTIDEVKINLSDLEGGFDTIYGFIQGEMGDKLVISSDLSIDAELFPLVSLENAPVANFNYGILRIVGPKLSTTSDIFDAFQVNGGLETLSISVGARSIIISADSQETGSNQCVFDVVGSEQGDLAITKLAVLQGNALDIDQWHADNFSFIA